MAAGESLCKLLCGAVGQDGQDDCEVNTVLAYLRSAITSCVDDIGWVFQQREDRIARYAPFLARAILELGATALIGRLDPTRVLFVKRTQEQPTYLPDRAWKTAIRWQGDVVAEKVQNLWTENANPKDMTRALVGDYYVNLYWKPAMERLADADISGGGAWLAAVQGLTADEFIGSRRSALSALFSNSSKAIHHEYVVPITSMFDRVTSKRLLANVVQTLAEFGVLVNMLAHTPYRLSRSESFLAIEDVERYEVGE